MSKKIHDQFCKTAAAISPKLSDAITSIGPLQLRKRQNEPLAQRLCRAVAGQQLSTKAATTIWGRVIDSANGMPLHQFVSAASIESLRNCGLSGSKSKAMKAIATAESSNLLNVDALSKLTHAQRSEELTSIWGVGQWTADMISIFYFGDKDVWPDCDITARKTLERLTSRRRKTTKTANRFAPHRSYLALYMYRIADAKP